MDQRSCETLHELVKMQETARFPADGENDELREPDACLSHIRHLLLRCKSRESYSRTIEGSTYLRRHFCCGLRYVKASKGRLDLM